MGNGKGETAGGFVWFFWFVWFVWLGWLAQPALAYITSPFRDGIIPSRDRFFILPNSLPIRVGTTQFPS
jgi:hypothetical protein